MIASVLLALTACGGGDSGDQAAGDTETTPEGTTSTPVTLPLAERALDDPDVTTAASDLAPSQTGASTVPPPATPDPCTAGDVEMWTAQVAPDGSSAVIRMQNASDGWCEPDVGRSPRLDPAIEPDVWLLPGVTADLVVARRDAECTDPTIVDLVQVGIGRESVLVPSALVACDWWLSAFYPNDDVAEACAPADLDVAVTANSVAVRNASATPCALGGLVGVDGAEVTSDSTSGPAVRALFTGDVVSFGRPGDADCDGVTDRVVLRDEAVGEIEVLAVPCSIVFEIGPPRPWYGTDVGPVASGADADPASFIERLDPFGTGE